LKFEGFGKLDRLDMSSWPSKKRRFHKDTYPGSPWNKGDFILWHGCKKHDNNCWETEIGAGRPAWNIQDASIVTKHLGFAIDVACGGIDNLVRHHDYTIAIAEGASDCIFSRYWLHGEHLFVNSKKMSKSRGRVYYIEDLLTKGFQNEELRFFLIYGHYREKLNFTWKQLAENSRKIRALRSMLQELENAASSISSENASVFVAKIIPNFERHMNDDLDVKAAFDTLYHTVVTLHRLMKQRKLSDEDAKTAISGLRRINSVLEVIF
jgi:cysteinyl-tRNA synthetase